MNIKSFYLLLLLLATFLFVGCYTKFSLDETLHMKQVKENNEEKTEIEAKGDSESESFEGYYGRRKPTKGSYRSYVDDAYWGRYSPYYYNGYFPPHIYSYRYPWYSGYYGYYPYRSYSPYGSGYYGRYHSSGFYGTPRGTYKKSTVLKSQRRSQSSRSVTSRRIKTRRSQ